jgi:hypothetical protein
MDVIPPPLSKLTIFGKLQIDDNAGRNLTADDIIVCGTFSAGSTGSPFKNNLIITLTGVPGSPSIIVTNSHGFDLGNRIIVVFSLMHIVNVTFTSLATTANAGDTTITLSTAVDWKVGDSIVLSATEYGSEQVEKAAITTVSSSKLMHTLAAPLSFPPLLVI